MVKSMEVEFFQKYFIDPIYEGTGYNPVNTVVYGLLLGIGIILCYKLLEKLNVKIDEKFFIALLPFITLGAFLRALEDARLLPKSALFITPGIFFTTFALAAAALVISLLLQSKIEYHKTMPALGCVLLIYPALLSLKNIYTFKPLLYVAAVFAISCALVLIALRFYTSDGWIHAAFAAHLLDASATVVGVEFFGYWEEHVFERMLIDKLGTAFVLFPLKIAVLLLVIFVVQKILDRDAAKFWYFALFVLGFAPGLRDLLKIMLLG